MRKKPRWKKNLRKVPPNILTKVHSFAQNECIASCIVKIPKTDISLGIFNHLGIRLSGGKLECPEQIIPVPAVGKYSSRNRYGYWIVYKNEPKMPKTYSIDAPNYGDWTKGSHEVEWTRDVYRREIVAPKLASILIELVGDDIRNEAFVFTFSISEVMDRTDAEFEERLLFNLNLLQENVGNHDVFESDVSRDDYLRTLYVNWEILPPGEKDETIAKIFSGMRSDDPYLRAKLIERYEFLQTLRPRNFIRGVSGFQNYFGAQFADDFVVFENVEYGNAIYIMFEDWKELSKKSRIELLSTNTQNFIRIRHTKTWKARLRRIIQSELEKRKS
ncbi:MAG: hypothetical protein M5U29_02545 [Anaerolineae bacterium]|nr:hypothetical protein [Anaerolineae bacterium]